MAFEFKEEVTDLFIINGISEGFHKVNRLKARELAERSHAFVKSVEETGGNKHAAELEANEAVVDLLTKIMLSDFKDYATDFNSVYSDEKLALAFHDLDKAEANHAEKIKKIEEEAKESAANHTVLAWIASIVIILFIAGFLFL
ncbi:hypothetical protein [Atlantibacter subterraneus]|uniref:hypothetical protein n=1 Tax=Atlantibacter subterraneus TaxID=255519 RepID=UPI0028A250B3|nr:hypothetical protein [Atlantibacter subterranea]